MSKKITATIDIDYDLVRKVYCMMTGKILSDEQIDSCSISDEFNITEFINENEEAKAAITMFAVAAIMEHEPKDKSTTKSKWQQKLEEIQKAQKERK